MTDDELDRLEVLAGKATQGEWFYEAGETEQEAGSIYSHQYDSDGRRCTHDYDYLLAETHHSREDAEFIAAFNPRTAKALITGFRWMRTLLRSLSEYSE
jgi:hypothetical protein